MNITSFMGNILKNAYDPSVEYDRGFSAGVNAERLVKEKEWAEREYDLLCRGAELERQRILADLETEIEEISAAEFEELTGMDKEPFGFVGTIDDLSLVLDESEVTA